ncbi:hypothetical protein [Pseudomonas sp. MWU13-3659]|uniref:hypothetical protein n=1 Tax=Pseudomonas sp. MWU13-3659 TaxID=2986964 RepID=UPI0020763B4C|nr:hypothetical protein [Pseudomonas sp. MWU13-3659]
MTEALEWCVVVWDFAGSPAADKSVNWSTVAIALTSGLIGIGGSWLALGWQAWRESRSVRAAILSEVEALVEIAGRQRYGIQLSDAIKNWNPRPSAYGPGVSVRRVRLNIPEHYNRVYLANAPKLGVLNEKDARNVVRFYQLIDSLRADTSEGGGLYEGTDDYEQMKTAYRTFETALELGKSLAIR